MSLNRLRITDVVLFYKYILHLNVGRDSFVFRIEKTLVRNAIKLNIYSCQELRIMYAGFMQDFRVKVELRSHFSLLSYLYIV